MLFKCNPAQGPGFQQCQNVPRVHAKIVSALFILTLRIFLCVVLVDFNIVCFWPVLFLLLVLDCLPVYDLRVIKLLNHFPPTSLL